MNSATISAGALVVPVAQGHITHHFRDVYQKLGRKAARALAHGDSGMSWALFRGCSEAQALEWAAAQGWTPHRPSVEHDCSGEICASGAYAQSCGLGILVRASWARDV